MPPPVGQDKFVYSAVPTPLNNSCPHLAKPLTVYSERPTEYVDVLNIMVSLPPFSESADIYLALRWSGDPSSLRNVSHDLDFQRVSLGEVEQAFNSGRRPSGLDPWIKSVKAPTDLEIVRNFPASALPSGRYDSYLLAAPEDRLDRFYLWQTSFCITPGLLSLVINYPVEPELLTLQDVRRTHKTVKDSGFDISHLYYSWGDIELAHGQYDWSNIDFAFQMIREQGLRTSLVIDIIDSIRLGTMPADVAFSSFEESGFRARVKAFLGALLDRYDNAISYLWIGNEIDSYFYNRRDEFDSYVSLYREIYNAVKAGHPGVRIGTISTYHDAKNNNALDLIEKIGRYGDLIGFSLYPQMITKSSRQPDAILTDMDTIARKTATRFAITETAWSTQGFGGSESAQAQYLRDLFRSYMSRRGQVEFLGFFILYDLPESVNRSLAEHYGTAGHEEYLQFQGALGLARSNGQPKEGWTTMLEEVSRMGKGTCD